MTRYAAFSECKGRNRVVFRLIFVIIIGGITALRSQPGVSSIDFTGQKNILLQKLDSLDMEKQSRKRLGQSIEDLEKTNRDNKSANATVSPKKHSRNKAFVFKRLCSIYSSKHLRLDRGSGWFHGNYRGHDFMHRAYRHAF